MLRKITALFISFCFVFEQTSFAQMAVPLSMPLSQTASSSDRFHPVHLRSIGYDQYNDAFSLTLDKGDLKKAGDAQAKDESRVLFEYFRTGLVLPNSTFWVNLRPDAASDIIDPALEKTDLGKVLLEADVQLKKDLANFTSPRTTEGREYWQKLYAKAETVYGNSEIRIPTLARPWIVPAEVFVSRSKDGMSAYVYKATLQVMLEQDYLNNGTELNFSDQRQKEVNEYAAGLIRQLIIPRLNRDVNIARRYAPLRQAYYSLILAQWFKQQFNATRTGYASLIDSGDVAGLSTQSWSKDTYFNQYRDSFNNGEFRVQENVVLSNGRTGLRTYTSGGFKLGNVFAGPGAGREIFDGGAPVTDPNDITVAVKGGVFNVKRDDGGEAPPALEANLAAEVIKHKAHLDIIKKLLGMNQGHLFAKWDKPGINDDKKEAFLDQVIAMDQMYTGGLEAYQKNALGLLEKAKKGEVGSSDKQPVEVKVPQGEQLTTIDQRFLNMEALGLKQVNKAAFVMVAGGMGQRLGYDEIKLSIPMNLVTMTTYLEKYIRDILALQKASNAVNNENRKIPLVIMISSKTRGQTVKLLEENDYFGMDRDQVSLVIQDDVPSIVNSNGDFKLVDNDPYRLDADPHGHGDIHMLVARNKFVDKWLKEGITHTIFIQDTNGQVFNGVLPGLGVSLEKKFAFNFLTVPRDAREKAGAIAQIVRQDKSTQVGNVEYNVLDPLLQTIGDKKGDVPDEKTGKSPYPGNLNVYIIENNAYNQALQNTKGIIAEMINPKYKKGSQTAFEKPVRLETMMQDLAFEMDGEKATVGFTNFDKRDVFSPVKNKMEAVPGIVANKNYPDAMPTGEADFYKFNRKLLQLAGVHINVQGKPRTTQGIPYDDGAKVVLGKGFAATVAGVLGNKFKGDNTVSDKSTLVVDGNVTFENLTLNGTLIVKAGPGVTINVKDLTVGNAGWSFKNLTPEEMDAKSGTPIYLRQLRGYKLDKNGQYEIVINEPGTHTISMTGDFIRQSLSDKDYYSSSLEEKGKKLIALDKELRDNPNPQNIRSLEELVAKREFYGITLSDLVEALYQQQNDVGSIAYRLDEGQPIQYFGMFKAELQQGRTRRKDQTAWVDQVKAAKTFEEIIPILLDLKEKTGFLPGNALQLAVARQIESLFGQAQLEAYVKKVQDAIPGADYAKLSQVYAESKMEKAALNALNQRELTPDPEKKCLLCSTVIVNQFKTERGLPWNDYNLFFNLYPYASYGMVFGFREHTVQQMERSNFEDMLKLSKELPAFRVVFNARGAGASSPDHKHLQAFKEELPAEQLFNHLNRNSLLAWGGYKGVQACFLPQYPAAVFVMKSADTQALSANAQEIVDILSREPLKDVTDGKERIVSTYTYNILSKYHPEDTENPYYIFVYPRKWNGMKNPTGIAEMNGKKVCELPADFAKQSETAIRNEISAAGMSRKEFLGLIGLKWDAQDKYMDMKQTVSDMLTESVVTVDDFTALLPYSDVNDRVAYSAMKNWYREVLEANNAEIVYQVDKVVRDESGSQKDAVKAKLQQIKRDAMVDLVSSTEHRLKPVYFDLLAKVRAGQLTYNQVGDTLVSINDWLTRRGYPKQEVIKLNALLNENTPASRAEIIDCFYQELAFGTAGVRGQQTDKDRAIADVLPGPNRMNDYTVSRYTLAQANFLKSKNRQEEGVVVGGDTRIKSAVARPDRDESAYTLLQSKILSKKGVKVYRFPQPRSIAEAAWATTYKGAASMAYDSASHNLWHDNGVKASNEFSSQLFGNEKTEMLGFMNDVLPEDIANLNLDDYQQTETLLGAEIDQVYMELNRSYVQNKQMVSEYSDQVRSFYTPLHGTGYFTLKDTLNNGKDFKFNVDVFWPQAEQDAARQFGTVEKPDPAYKNKETGRRTMDPAVEAAIKSGKNYDFIFGTDPDADRSLYMVKDSNGNYKEIPANDVWALFTWYMASQRQLQSKAGRAMPTHVIKTWVTTDLIKAIAQDFGLKVKEPAVGFSKIGEVALKEIALPELGITVDDKELMADLTLEKLVEKVKEKHPELNTRQEVMKKINAILKEKLLLGAEESNGFSPGGHTLEKDGAVAAVLFHEIAAYVKYLNAKIQNGDKSEPAGLDVKGYVDANTVNGKVKELTIYDLLNMVYLKYGYYASANEPLEFKGLQGNKEKERVLKVLAAKVTDFTGLNIDGQPVTAAMIGDKFINGAGQVDKAIIFKESGFRFEMGKDQWVTVRPSGTEPLARFYSQLKVEAKDLNWGNIEKIKKDADERAVKQSLAAQVTFVKADGGNDPLDPANNDKRMPGGIDFRGLPIIQQPLGEYLRTFFAQPAGTQVGDLDSEWSHIEGLVRMQVVPQATEIRDFLTACYNQGELEQRMDALSLCVGRIMRLEEDKAATSEPEMRKILVLLESAR